MYRITMLYDNDPTRIIIATLNTQTAKFGWDGRGMALCVGGPITIEKIEGPRYDVENDDQTVEQSDWNSLLDGSLGHLAKHPPALIADANGWRLDLHTNDWCTSVEVLEPVEVIE